MEVRLETRPETEEKQRLDVLRRLLRETERRTVSRRPYGAYQFRRCEIQYSLVRIQRSVEVQIEDFLPREANVLPDHSSQAPVDESPNWPDDRTL